MGPNNHLLLVAEDEGISATLEEATQALNAGARVSWICCTATSSTATALEHMCALKNKHLARLNLLIITREESQPFDILTGVLDHDKLRRCSELLFDANSVSHARVAASSARTQELTDWVNGLLSGVAVVQLTQDRSTPHDPSTAADGAPVDEGSGADTVQVRIIQNGREHRFAMNANTGTLLDGADDAGIDLPFSCRGGVCSTCRARLVVGEVELYENYALEDWELEAGFTLPCQAEPVSKEITLDYDQV